MLFAFEQLIINTEEDHEIKFLGEQVNNQTEIDRQKQQE